MVRPVNEQQIPGSSPLPQEKRNPVWAAVSSFFQRIKVMFNCLVNRFFAKASDLPVRTTVISSPKIIDDDWGMIKLDIAGKQHEFKDVVIFSDSAKPWNWGWEKSDSMHHNPGYRKEDFEHYLFSSDKSSPAVVILSTGRGHGGKKDNPGPGVLQVDQSLVGYLKGKGVQEVFCLKTNLAIEKYKELASKNIKLVAFIHTTC